MSASDSVYPRTATENLAIVHQRGSGVDLGWRWDTPFGISLGSSTVCDTL